MKTTAKSEADALVEWLFSDMDNRSFDTGMVDADVLTEWKDAWSAKIEAALSHALTSGRVLGHGESVEWLRERHNGTLRPTAADLSAHLHGVRSNADH